MIKTILISIVFLLSQYSYSCFSFKSGDKYDELIQIMALKEPNQFEAKIPVKAFELTYGASIYLAQTKLFPDENYVYVEDRSKLITTKVGDYLFAYFEAINKSGFESSIQVTWNPESGGMCGAYGYSKALKNYRK